MTTPATEGVLLFDTAIGRCGVAWNAIGISAVQLPEVDDDATLARLRRRAPGAVLAVQAVPAVPAVPPEAVARAVEAITALLDGAAEDLAFVALDLSGVSAFDCGVYEVTRSIAPGSTLSYGEVAARVGAPGAARAVGRALGDNPFPIVVPCHRVVAADGRMHGFSAAGGVETKRRMLQIEGARAAAPTLF